MTSKDKLSNEDIEITLLLEAIHLKYGYDFRGYALSSLKRRLKHRLHRSGLSSFADMQHRILNDVPFFESVLMDLSINVTEMFRDPPFYAAFREKVVPALRTMSLLKIWHAGCATGEEVYSMAILLTEEGLYERARIYATDINEVVVSKAKKGIFSIEQMKAFSQNYQLAGGQGSLADYFTASDRAVIMDNTLKQKLVFSDHNLATDGVFGEMDVIVCRNVLIYFEKSLQNRVLQLFCDSLAPEGYLCLGSRESIRFSSCAAAFEEVDGKERIYRKRC